MNGAMTDEVVFRVLLVAVLVGAAAVRMVYGVSSKRSGGRLSVSENKLVMGVMGVVGLVGAYLLLGYLVFPGWVAWAALPLPSWLRWVGVAMGITTIPLLFWVHRTLGKYFSAALQVRDEHVLVTSGPYRWVRHPMYTVLLMLMVALLPISDNWAIGAVFVGVAVVFIPIRVRQEEAMMVEKFGDDYRAYQGRTGRLLTLKFLALLVVSCLVVFFVLWLLSTFVLGFLPVDLRFF